LKGLQGRYPNLIHDVRGQGLMVGLELADVSRTFPYGLRGAASVLDEKLKGSLAGLVACLLLRNYNVLVALTEYNRNVIRLEPPLICDRMHIEAVADALDDLLSRGITRIISDYV